MPNAESSLGVYTAANISAVSGESIFINVPTQSRRLYITSISWGYQPGLPADAAIPPLGMMLVARNQQFVSGFLYGNPSGITPKNGLGVIVFDTLSAFGARHLIFERGNEPYIEAGEPGLIIVSAPTPSTGAAYNTVLSTLLVKTRYDEGETGRAQPRPRQW